MRIFKEERCVKPVYLLYLLVALGSFTDGKLLKRILIRAGGADYSALKTRTGHLRVSDQYRFIADVTTSAGSSDGISNQIKIFYSGNL